MAYRIEMRAICKWAEAKRTTVYDLAIWALTFVLCDALIAIAIGIALGNYPHW